MEGKIDHDKLVFVIIKGKLYNFNRYRNLSMLFTDIRKEKIKLAEAFDLQTKFKRELSDIKKDNKSTKNASIIDNTKIHFNEQEKILKLHNGYAELMSEAKSQLF